MKKLFYGALSVALAASLGCAITDYPVIEDDRGGYSGVIRTAHKAYVVPSGQVATIYADGSDELFSMVYQNQYGDQSLYTFNNFDPTGAVSFLDQTYCDWQYQGCEITRAWNPTQNDDPFDYEFFADCSGARSLSLLVDYASRIGECGDNIFRREPQSVARLFANLQPTTWHGENAYVVPIAPNNFWMTLTAPDGTVSSVPIYGRYTMFLNDRYQLAIPMTPNALHQLNWMNQWVSEHGTKATMWIAYEGVTGTIDVTFKRDGFAYNANRF